MSDIKDEKEKLMKDILYNRKSNFNSIDAKEYLERKNKLLKEAGDIITKLDDLVKNKPNYSESLSDNQLLKLQEDIEKDFGIKFSKNEYINDFDSVSNSLKNIIIGQDEAVEKLMIAVKRLNILKENKNTILITGGKGLGKHSIITNLAKLLKNNSIIESENVYFIDMSLYTSQAQEHIFLQDLYVSIKGKGKFICFENFESSSSIFLRMIEELVVKGNLTLNKRYVDNKGQLMENQTGLVNNPISNLSVNDKYLVFISNNKVSKVTDYFGMEFIENINDIVEFKQLDEESLKQIITQNLFELSTKIKQNLNLNINFEENINTYILNNYDKELGVIGVKNIIDDIYQKLSDLKLKQELRYNETIVVSSNETMINIKYQNKEQCISKIKNNDEILDEINSELHQIIGLNEVKEYISSLKSHMIIQQRRKQQGLKSSEISKHMIFIGNPGTGKTTIARLISRYMKAIGVLSKGQLVEVTRSNLVGKYVGHTAPLTMQVIKSALGGVLFIDEAYSLYRGSDDSFGLEAIDTIVKAMEDERDDLIVILAGYSKEMNEFLEANSGLKSRFPNIIEFKDYTGEELLEISDIIARKNGYIIDEKARERLQEYYAEIQISNSNSSGNGRLARNKIEEAILNQSNRLINENDGQIDLLKLEDFKLYNKEGE